MTSGSDKVIPATRFGYAYRVLLVVGGLVAVVGIAGASRGLFWLVLNRSVGSGAPMMEFATLGLKLAAWALVAVAAYTGWRRNVLPATWVLVAIPLLAWALLIAQRYA